MSNIAKFNSVRLSKNINICKKYNNLKYNYFNKYSE